MEYKEKWLSLKEEIESVVNLGLQRIGQMSIENQNRFIAYRNILDSMYELDEDELKTIEKENKMRILKTTQTQQKLNDIYITDKKGNGGAYHNYLITPIDKNQDEKNDIGWKICFQNGARKEPNSESGIIDSDLLEIVKDRLTCFQQSDFKCYENDMMLYHIKEALDWSNRRIKNRLERNVLGKNIK